MNEQLIVKNFGPIKDATVDFKRVTVFIGPTGGGKSTLAKLAAVLREVRNYTGGQKGFPQSLSNTGLKNYSTDNSSLHWHSTRMSARLLKGKWEVKADNELSIEMRLLNAKASSALAEFQKLQQLLKESPADHEIISNRINELYKINHELDAFYGETIAPAKPNYFPAERILLSALNSSWPDLIKGDVNLPSYLLDFVKGFLQSRDHIQKILVSLFDVIYNYQEGKDFVILLDGTIIPLSETASGIQSVTPLLVLLEHLSRNTEQAQSFIIEEPELNLFPLAQFELVKILVEKCAQTEGKNDLVLTTHSPYVLTALNLLCYAYRIAQQDEATAKKVAKLIPRHCWIDPDQFAAYYVDRPDTKRKQQVRSIINKKTGLIEENELDTASDELGAIFDKLVRLRKPTQTPSRAK